MLARVSGQANVVVDADRVALWALASGEVGWVAGLGIAALGTGTLNVDPLVVHVTHGPAEGDVRAIRTADLAPVDVCGAAPVASEVALSCFVGDAGRVE